MSFVVSTVLNIKIDPPKTFINQGGPRRRLIERRDLDSSWDIHIESQKPAGGLSRHLS